MREGEGEDRFLDRRERDADLQGPLFLLPSVALDFVGGDSKDGKRLNGASQKECDTGKEVGEGGKVEETDIARRSVCNSRNVKGIMVSVPSFSLHYRIPK